MIFALERERQPAADAALVLGKHSSDPSLNR